MMPFLLVVSVAGSIQFALPMRDSRTCQVNQHQWQQMTRPDLVDKLSIRCFDIGAQMYLAPGPQGEPVE